MTRFSRDTPWYKRLWYEYMLLAAWLYYDYISHPISKKVTDLRYKWKYRKEHREMKKRYKRL